MLNWALSGQKIWTGCRFGWIAAAVAFAVTTCASCVSAQIIPDATLKTESSVVTRNLINGILTHRIDGGAIRGANLFHSFQEFNIGIAETAYFANPVGINNILTRVTGSNPSNILGTLGVLGNANLFLINPNGIIFGPSASLDVHGSFVATTSNAIGFGNQGFFSATAPSVPPVLTVNPSAFLFNQIKSASITNQSVEGLQVPDGQSLLLLGGDVRLDGEQLLASGGRIELGGIAGSGIVGLNVDGSNLQLSFPQESRRSNVRLTNNALVAVTNAGGGGSIVINAQDVDFVKSLVSAGIDPGLGSIGIAGDITLNATGVITLDSSVIRNNVNFNAVGDAGNINIISGSLSLINGTQIFTGTLGQGNAGNVFVVAPISVDLENRSIISSTVGPLGGVGNGGSLIIDTGTLSLKSGAQIQTGVARALNGFPGGQGEGGNILINAANSVDLSGSSSNGFSSGLFTSTEQGAVGNGGDIMVNTHAFRIANGAVVNAQTFNSSSGGNIIIKADSFVAANGGQILSDTRSQGHGGTLALNVTSSVNISGSDPNFAQRFAKFGRSVVNNESPASGLFASTDAQSTGNGGSISVSTTNLNLTNGAEVSVSSQGLGNAGDIKLVTGSLYMDKLGSLRASTASGEGGNITLNATDLTLRTNSLISATAGDSGNGGNIKLSLDRVVALENSNITANAYKGRGGNIQIITQGIFLSPDSNITASSQLGINGVVQVTTLGFDVKNSLTPIKTNLVTTEQAIANSCLARRNVEQGRFIITGTGGLPRTPYDSFNGRYDVSLVKPLPGRQDGAQRVNQLPMPRGWKLGDPIVEAQSIVRLADGRTVLATTTQIAAIAKVQKQVCHLLTPESGVRSQESGVRSQESGVRRQESVRL